MAAPGYCCVAHVHWLILGTGGIIECLQYAVSLRRQRLREHCSAQTPLNDMWFQRCPLVSSRRDDMPIQKSMPAAQPAWAFVRPRRMGMSDCPQPRATPIFPAHTRQEPPAWSAHTTMWPSWPRPTAGPRRLPQISCSCRCAPSELWPCLVASRGTTSQAFVSSGLGDSYLVEFPRIQKCA